VHSSWHLPVISSHINDRSSRHAPVVGSVMSDILRPAPVGDAAVVNRAITS
jgi:hypothetical protein